MATLQEIMQLGTLNECTIECTRQSRWKETTQRYLANMLLNNLELQEEVLEGRYKVRPTTDFMLSERGHVRKIEAPSVRDRIVQKTLMKNVLIPALRPCLIYDNYASLAYRGTSFARKRFEIQLRRYYIKHGTQGYILMIDVRKYFENIDHDILKKIIADKISNQPKEVIDLIHYIIDTSSHSHKGLNLGSECPQIFAVYYLHAVDHFVKVVKRVKYYGRYMDDIFVIARTKQELIDLLGEIEEKLYDLKLEINQKKTSIVKLTHGFTYLQVKYNILPSGKIIKRMSHGKIARERRRLKAFHRMLEVGQMTEEEIYNCYQSWRGSSVVDHNACATTIRKMDCIYRSLFPAHVPTVRKGRRQISNEILASIDKEDIVHIF